MNDSSPVFDSASTSTTKRLLDAELAAVAAGDLEALVDLFAEDGVILSQQGAFCGHDQIRSMFADFFAGSSPEDRFAVVHESVRGRFGYIVWTAETVTSTTSLGTDTFVVENGKIALLSFAAHTVAKA